MDILNEAIKQGIAPAIVVAIYLIISKIIDSRKEKTQLKLTENLTNSINTISQFIINITKNIIDKDTNKCRIAIEDAINASSSRLIMFVCNTIINNHITINKDNILMNIENIVNSEYYTICATLSLYKIDNKKPVDYMNPTWMDDLRNDIISIIYNDKLSKEEKIQSFNNKINIKFQKYITYIINNTMR